MMNKAITLFLLQLAQTLFSIGIWTALVLIWHQMEFKTLHGVWNYVGLRKSEKGAFLRSGGPIALAYLFTVAIFVVLKNVNGGMSAEMLTQVRDTVSLPVLIIIILMVGVRSGFGEELFFRGLIANRLFARGSAMKANLLQAVIFTIPHILTFATLPVLESILLLLNAFIIGFALGYITHRENGCIIPAIVYHGVINMIAIPITWFPM